MTNIVTSYVKRIVGVTSFNREKRAPCITKTVWPPNFAGKSKCCNQKTFMENVHLNNCSLGFGYYFFLMTTFRLKIDIKFEETSKNMSFSAFLTTSNTWLV